MTAAENILVVGVASSAGGLEPLTELIEKAVCHENMAFILVPHLNREQSYLAQIMKRFSSLVIKTITHDMVIEKCHLYILPPNYYAVVRENRLQLIDRPKSNINHSADVLFKSLAEYYKENSIGVILSGVDVEADGAEGIVEIKNHGGHTYAQDPQTAAFPGMPKAAIATGKIDSVMSATEIGNELTLVSWAS